MHHLIRAIAIIALFASCVSARALDAAKSAAIVKAADQFVALAADSATTGKPPRQTDPAAKPLLDLVFDTKELETGPVNPMSALGTINGWNQAVLKIGLVYILAGTGTNDISTLSDNAATTDRITRNTVEFAAEMGRYMDAQLWLQIAITDTVVNFVASATPAELDRPNVKSGLGQIRSGIARTINGVITTLPTEGLSDTWRAERMAALVAIGPRAGRLVLPEDLATLRVSATEVAGRIADPRVKTGLASFAASLAPR